MDQAFQRLVKGELGKKWDKMTNDQIKKIMNDEWEHGIKRGFADSDKIWEVRLPSEATTGSRIRRPRTQMLNLNKYMPSNPFSKITC